MEQFKTQGTKSVVRIRIEDPTNSESGQPPKPLGPIQPEKLSLLYRTLLALTYPISAASLFLAFTA